MENNNSASAIESRFAINPFGKQIEVERRPEFVQEIEMSNGLDETIEKCLAQFDELKQKTRGKSVNEQKGIALKVMEKMDLEIINPAQIEILLHQLIKEKINDVYESVIIGIYLTSFIQKSYNDGHNNFTLTMQDQEINHLACLLKGTQKNPISLVICGNAGYYFGEESKNCSYELQGNAGSYCGYKSKNCTYSIREDAGSFLGVDSINCTYSIHRDMGNCHGVNNANGNIYKTSKISTFYKMLNHVPIGNAKQMLDKNGMIVMEKK